MVTQRRNAFALACASEYQVVEATLIDDVHFLGPPGVRDSSLPLFIFVKTYEGLVWFRKSECRAGVTRHEPDCHRF